MNSSNWNTTILGQLNGAKCLNMKYAIYMPSTLRSRYKKKEIEKQTEFQEKKSEFDTLISIKGAPIAKFFKAQSSMSTRPTLYQYSYKFGLCKFLQISTKRILIIQVQWGQIGTWKPATRLREEQACDRGARVFRRGGGHWQVEFETTTDST